MKLIDDLREDHDLIDQVVGSFRTFVDQRLRGGGDPADGARFIAFFRLFAGDFHHAKEEATLFPALQRQADLPERGPIAVLTGDHRRMGELVASAGALLDQGLLTTADSERLRTLALEYSHALWHHIDAENSVLFPESEARLAKKGVRELPSREMTAEEADARRAGEDLVRRYPPFMDPDIVRGDGCVSCHAFGESCRGLEREWWNEWEWEEFQDRMGSE